MGMKLDDISENIIDGNVLRTITLRKKRKEEIKMKKTWKVFCRV